MVAEDVDYVKRLLEAGLVRSPCLELGVGYQGPNCKAVIEQAGLSYLGTDMQAGASVDIVADFERPPEDLARAFGGAGRFGSILALNVLEHTFDPIRVLDNIVSLLQPGGTGVFVTPVVWPLHGYPKDYWRINPNFYEDYCERRSLRLMREHFEYLGKQNVEAGRTPSGSYVLPAPSQGKLHARVSRLVHRVFNTYGRGMCFPSHVAIGAVIRR